MECLKLKPSIADDLLRKCFEAGISYNLLLGTFVDREKKEINNFERSLDDIHLFDRPHAYTLLNQAFNPRAEVEYTIARLNFELQCPGSLGAYLYCVVKNYPHWPLELFTRAKRSALEPKNILRAYYAVRTMLEKHRQHDHEMVITDPTLIALYELEKKRKLTSHLVSVDEQPIQNGITSFVIHSHGLFSYRSNEQHHSNERWLGQEHRHILEVARELEMGRDPLDKVRYALLNGQRVSQWSSTLLALCCYCENISAQSFCKNHLDRVPRRYHSDLRDVNLIKHQLKKFPQREKSLWQFLKPSPDDYFKSQKKPFEQADPILIKKMVLCHFIMLYLTVLSHSSWSIRMRKCVEIFKKRHPHEHQKKWVECMMTDTRNSPDAPLLREVQKLFDSNPVGLYPWMWGSEFPDPLALMTHYLGSKDKPSNEQLVKLNMFYKQLRLDITALIIPQCLNIDTSPWFKKSVWVQMGKTCTFFGPSSLPLEERLSLASLLITNQYTVQTLKDNMLMETKQLEHLLLGICYLWHNTMIERISQSRFLDYLVTYSLGNMTEATLRKRIAIARKWLKQWPDVTLFERL